MAVKRTSSGQRNQEIALTRPGPRVRGNDGNYTSTPEPLSPATAWARLELANAKALENVAASTTLGIATHVLTIPYHPQVSLKTHVAWIDRLGHSHNANVIGYSNPDGNAIETVMVIAEIIQ
jgi:hypothetical protein